MPDVPQSGSFLELRDAYNAAVGHMNACDNSIEEAKETLRRDPENEEVNLEALQREFDEAVADVERRAEELRSKDARDRARAQFTPFPVGKAPLEVKEPDIYQKGGRSFIHDLYMAQMQHDAGARERIDRHQKYEAEQRAVTTGTLGGIIPPAYLIDLYAKAGRNGRVFADQVNKQTLPDVGMSVIVPRLTQGTATGSQATENTTVTTQDPTETDLSVGVKTIAGYSPVSRQTLERGGYSDEILFEDLIARYWAQLDTQAINGGGGSGTLLGLLQTSGIATSTASTATVVGVWPKIADVIQQINTSMGGLGYVASKIVMHPRRWGFFDAALDSSNRPLSLIAGAGQGVNVMAVGNEAGYGYVGQMHGLPVYTDANIPTNTGTNTNQDSILVFASPVVHLWERGGDPVTLSFEQQAGTSLQVQLVAYGYVAFTAGRYPAASGAVTGAGLVPPTF
jgi:HK97 family phage major capsid protein